MQPLLFFFSSFFPVLALSFSPFLFLRYYDFGASRAKESLRFFTQMTANFVRLPRDFFCFLQQCYIIRELMLMKNGCEGDYTWSGTRMCLCYSFTLVRGLCSIVVENRRNLLVWKRGNLQREEFESYHINRMSESYHISNLWTLYNSGHFRVPPGLCFKARVGAQPLILKSLFILTEIKLIFTRKVDCAPSLILKVRVFWNSEVA